MGNLNYQTTQTGEWVYRIFWTINHLVWEMDEDILVN